MSAPTRRARFLSPNRISELVWDSENDEAGTTSDSISEDEGGFQDGPRVSRLQPDRPTSSGQVSSRSFSSSASDEEDVFPEYVRSAGSNAIPFAVYTALWPSEKCRTHFHRGPQGEKSEAPHISDGYSPLSVFLLYFAEIIALLGGWRLTDTTTTTLTDLTDLHPT